MTGAKSIKCWFGMDWTAKAGGRGVTKRCSPLSKRNVGNIFIIAYYRSFLSSSSTEYGIARLPQPVPMEMCVLRVPWQSLPPEMPMPYVPAADGCIHIFFI